MSEPVMWLWNEEAETAEKRHGLIALAGEGRAETSEMIPALDRYTSPPIRQIFLQAHREQAAFRIVSASYGLLPANTAVGTDGELPTLLELDVNPIHLNAQEFV